MTAVTLDPDFIGGYHTLRQASRVFADVQNERIRVVQRIGSDNPIVKQLGVAEDEARSWVETVFKEVAPSGVIRLVKDTPGLSPYLVGRLLGEAGHPRIATPYKQVPNPDFDPDAPRSADNPQRFAEPLEPFIRTQAQWRQRCGHGTPGRLPKEATQAEVLARGLPSAKVIVFLLIGGCFKLNGVADKNGRNRALSPYRTIIDVEKERYRERTHTGPCPGGFVSAGPGKVVFAKCKVTENSKQRYADAGDPFSAGHIQAIAFRHAGKQLLNDLWESAE